MKAALYTLGCKVNQYESQVMAEALAAAGYAIVDASEKADVYIVNSCTVTSESDRKTRQIVRPTLPPICRRRTSCSATAATTV